MKKIVKRPSFWIAFFCFVAGITLAVVSSVQNPEIPVVEKLESGVNKQDTKKIISCFPPEVQEEIRAELSLYSNMDMDVFGDIPEGGKVNLIYGDAVMDEDGYGSVPVFAIYTRDGVCEDVDYEEIDLQEIEGKLYLDSY